MIQVRELTKTFHDQKRGAVHALDHVSFDVQAGEIFGLLGPNGAGKTTALRLLATVLAPSAGSARVAGRDIVREPERVRRQIGFLSGDMGLYARLAPREVLAFFARLHGSADGSLAGRVARIIAQLEMESFADTKIDRLSTGMKQKDRAISLR
jgi:sodium transport system ATP-binding protein